jgi:CO/xanthine dehydrogenase Mo-binding subunit
MAAMRVVRSKVAHARITGIDFSAVANDPDCFGVFSAVDLPAGVGVLPALDLVDNSAPAYQNVLARDTVRYVGEPVAAILAADAYVAEDLAERVIVDYDVLPTVLSARAGLEPDAALLYPEFGSNVVHETTQRVGDPDRAFAATATIVEESFKFQRVIGSPMETRGAVAMLESAGERYVLYSSTQIPQILRKELARITGTSLSRLRVVAPHVGGGFGSKEAIYPEEVLLLLVLQKFGHDVYWLEDRDESFSATVHGREEEIHLRAAVDAEGIVTAVEADCLADIGAAYSLFSNTPGAAVATVRGPYRIPNFRSRARSVVTNKTPLNVYRGAGHPQAILSMERLLDLAAAAIGMDRAEIRRRNLLPPDVFPVDRGVAYPGCGPVVFDSGNFFALLCSTLEAIDYEGFSLRRSQAAPGFSLGLGLAFVVEMTGGGGAEPARLRLLADGRLQLCSGITPIGQGSETTLVQILSEHLGVPADTIEFVAGDTDESPDAPGTFASRGATMGGNAACRAGDAFIREACRLAARLRGVSEADVVWKDGALIERGGTSEPLTLKALWAEARGLVSSGALGVESRGLGSSGPLGVEARGLASSGRLGAEATGLARGGPVGAEATGLARGGPVGAEAAGLAPSGPLSAEAIGLGSGGPLEVSVEFQDTGVGFASACHAAVLEVDRATGAIGVIDYAVTHDCGRVANPLLVDGQIMGGVLQGLGGCLFEELRYDEAGMPLTHGYMDYVLPTAATAPRFILRHIETLSPLNPLGMKGAGEAGCSGAVAAIANALADALGPDIKLPCGSGPFTPELVLEALRKAQRGGASV